ncbi:MAG: cytochrome c-type biogenesis protein CcmH [Gammaproteobacteria bacterium]|nr:cytochrome c-type biogenesis protein CcmH [Gammaproteobacteria bacterium]HCP50574.1 cytochrome c-type biogenesis protein CcmH [Gammaproteobacteria bacterium]|tara:strand:+ start:897 stop:1334 length:438 start_codon:yes stop_codon:yes gene_type:complete
MVSSLISGMLATWIVAVSTIDAFEFEDEGERLRYNDLIAEFRCPKCLNTNLPGSDAPVARDLRRTVYRLVNEGMTDDQVRRYLQDRYGDFVLYDPPVRANTWILWFGPPILLLAGILVLRRIGSRVTRVFLSDDERARLEAIRKQ